MRLPARQLRRLLQPEAGGRLRRQLFTKKEDHEAHEDRLSDLLWPRKHEDDTRVIECDPRPAQPAHSGQKETWKRQTIGGGPFAFFTSLSDRCPLLGQLARKGTTSDKSQAIEIARFVTRRRFTLNTPAISHKSSRLTLICFLFSWPLSRARIGCADTSSEGTRATIGARYG
jgi:hypothetical protein